MRGLRVPNPWLVVLAVAGVGGAGAGGAPPDDLGVSAPPRMRAGPRVPEAGRAITPAERGPHDDTSTGAPASDVNGRGAHVAARPPRVPHADGPPLARTGGFGEHSCVECHLDLALNAPGGALLLEGVPASFTPGATYVVTVLVEGEGMGRAGFQAASRFHQGERSGRPAGRLAPLDGRTVVRGAGGVDYINHTVEGSELGAGDIASWSFEWVAPEEPSPVVFHVSGNSANGDNSPLGDLIYTTEVVVPPGG